MHKSYKTANINFIISLMYFANDFTVNINIAKYTVTNNCVLFKQNVSTITSSLPFCHFYQVRPKMGVFHFIKSPLQQVSTTMLPVMGYTLQVRLKISCSHARNSFLVKTVFKKLPKSIKIRFELLPKSKLPCFNGPQWCTINCSIR